VTGTGARPRDGEGHERGVTRRGLRVDRAALLEGDARVETTRILRSFYGFLFAPVNRSERKVRARPLAFALIRSTFFERST
jgi:hypothetical protein